MKMLETGTKFVKDNASTILTGVGMVGVVATAALATNSTIKAVKVLEGTETKKEIVQKTWKYYIPPVIVGGISMFCIFEANKISMEKIAAVTALYSLNEKRFKQYGEQVKKAIGVGKEEEIKDLVARDDMEKKPFREAQPIDINDDETLCFDQLTGRYFKSSIESIRRIVNDMNERMLTTGEGVTVNDIYYAWGLGGVSWGDDAGWTLEMTGLIDPRYSSQLTDEGKPCFCILLEPFMLD